MTELRLATKDDHRRIARDWVSSYASSDWARYCTPPGVWPRASAEYFAGHNALVDRLLERCGARVRDRDELIGGWACVDTTRDTPVLHFAYVRQLYRGEGIARALLADLLDREVVYSHRPRGLRDAKVPARWRFDPYAAFGGGHAVA